MAKKNTNRQCKPSLKFTFKKMAELLYCGICGDPLWEMVTDSGTSAGCRTCNGHLKPRKNNDD